ncbi:hypothetical protein Pst134EA_031753, partial [Puccinia striiformis f. sp. tritici]|uniref:uncharacterized protein n=1 Tax=Puccinia striiformis f. sp. tritici TaxID=168172 RepID=UPI002008C573
PSSRSQNQVEFWTKSAAQINLLKDASIILVLGFRLEEQYDNRASPTELFASLTFDRSGAIDGTGCQLFDLGAIISMLWSLHGQRSNVEVY